MTGALIIAITYGHDVKGPDNPVIRVAEEALDAVTHALTPGTFLVVSIVSRSLSHSTYQSLISHRSFGLGCHSCTQIRSRLGPRCRVQKECEGME